MLPANTRPAPRTRRCRTVTVQPGFPVPHTPGKLTALRTVAPLGSNAVAPSVRLASGPAPGAIAAVHHSAWKLAGYAAIMLAGLIVLLRARRLARRWRRRARLPTTQSHRIRPTAPAPVPSDEPALGGRRDPSRSPAPQSAPGSAPAAAEASDPAGQEA